MDVSETTTPGEDFDWEAFGLTPMQVAYCKARARGLNRTRAAIEAGYGGGNADPASGTIRSTASATEKSKLVAAALNAWRVHCGERSTAPLDDVEVDKELSRMARTATSETARLAALKTVAERNALRAEAAKSREQTPEEVSAALLKDGQPVSVLIGALLSKAAYPPLTVPRKAWRMVEIQYPETARALVNEWHIKVEPGDDDGAGEPRGHRPATSTNGSGHTGLAGGAGAGSRDAGDVQWERETA